MTDHIGDATTMIDLDALEKLADEVSSGPLSGTRGAEAAYRKAANPANIKALIAELKEGRRLVEQSIDLMTDEYEDTKAHQQQSRAFLARNGKGEG